MQTLPDRVAEIMCLPSSNRSPEVMQVAGCRVWYKSFHFVEVLYRFRHLIGFTQRMGK